MSEKKQMAKELLTVNDIRFHNKVNILTDIVKSSDVTRNELALRNQISIMTVKHIVDELLQNGLIEERTFRAAVGRKPMALNLAEYYGNIVCINLTCFGEISYIIYSLKQCVLEQKKIVFRADPKAYQEHLCDAMEQIKNSLGKLTTRTVGIAVFVPSAYYEEQDILNPDLITELKGLHIKKLFVDVFGLENVLVIHDTYAAAMSEYENMDSNHDSQFYLYCGDGVGGCFIHKGNAVYGDDLVAGEVGKMILAYDKKRKKTETLEERLSVPGIMKRIREGFPDMEFEAALDAYEQGEITIREIFDDALDTIARVLYHLIWVYNPTRIVIDSCYKKYGSLIKEHAERFFEEFQNSDISVRVQFTEAQYDEYHMMRGCMNLVLKKWIEQAVMFSAC